MTDLDLLLARKEHELERIAKEILALRTVISLLEESHRSSNEKFQIALESQLDNVVDPETDMNHLETYYGFVKHLNTAESAANSSPTMVPLV